MKDNNNEIGLRIRTARKQKGMNQTQLATELGKSLRTIPKYESEEIEVSIGAINDIAKVLDTTSTYLIGYQAETKTITNMADVMQFLFHLDQLNELGFSIDVKRPPNHDGYKQKKADTDNATMITHICFSYLYLFTLNLTT